MESVLRRRPVSGGAVCGMIPRKTRAPSSLHASGARSLTTKPLGKPAALAGSRTTGRAFAEFMATGTSGKTSSVLSRSRIFSTSRPLSAATPVPLVIPCQAAVAQRVVVECDGASVLEVHHEEAVAVAHGRVDGIGEQVAAAIEGASITLPRNWLRPVASSCNTASDARGVPPAPPAPPPPPPPPAGSAAAAAAPGRAGRPSAQQQMRRRGREGRALHVLPRHHGARWPVRAVPNAAAARAGSPPRPPQARGLRRWRGGGAPGARRHSDAVTAPARRRGPVAAAPRDTRAIASRARTDGCVAFGTSISSLVAMLRRCSTGFASSGSDVREAQAVRHPLSIRGDDTVVDRAPLGIVV